MDIKDGVDLKKSIIINNEITETHRYIDLSLMSEDSDKIEKSIRGFLGFLAYSGFDESDVFDITKEIVIGIDSHPDNDDFSLRASIEEEVNKDDNRNIFIKKIIDSEDTEFLKEVYRAWIITHYDKKA